MVVTWLIRENRQRKNVAVRDENAYETSSLNAVLGTVNVREHPLLGKASLREPAVGSSTGSSVIRCQLPPLLGKAIY